MSIQCSFWRFAVARGTAAIVFSTMLALNVASLGGVHAQTKTSAWSSVDCTTFKLENVPADSGVECGYVTVPLRHAAPDGSTIQLATVIIPSKAPDRQPDPLFMAQGGPGGSTIDTYANYLIGLPESRPTSNRDIVLWDQRGTLYSKPVLICPEVDQARLQSVLIDSAPSTEEDDLRPYRECGARLAREAGDLSAFNSAENADDAESVRAALGYEQFNFYGVSYGTELGQFIMRRQPANLRSVVLDAVVPLTYNLFTEPAFAKQRIATKYFNACAADVRCNAAFPDLANRYLALYERLNTSPITLTVKPLLDTTLYQVRLTGSGLENALYTSLYGDVHDLIPLIVDRADKGDFTYVTNALLPFTLFDASSAEGMHMTVACADRADTNPDTVDYSQINPRLAEAERTDAKAELELCRAWKIELLPRDELELVSSNLPVLMLSGDFDPITPPEYAKQILPLLPNAQHVIFPLGAHGQAVTSPCSNGIITAFLDNPSAAVDTTCVPLDGPQFLTDADIITIPVLRDALAAGGLLGPQAMVTLVRTAPGLLGALFLLTTVVVYPLGWLMRLVLRRPVVGATSGWTVGWSRAAPWLALLVGLVLLVFFVGLGSALSATLFGNQNLFMLGAISGSWRWLFVLPIIAALLVALMVVCAIALWLGRHGSRAGRIYYTLLTLTGIIGLSTLTSLGMLGLWFA